MPNPNHPPKNSIIRVEAIRDLKDIKNIKRLLQAKPRDLAIFTLGINVNLRGSDLLKITVGQIRHLKPGESFHVREKKTGKERSITINKVVFEAIQALLKSMKDEVRDSDYLFQSRIGKGMLTVPYLNSLLKGWCKAINLKGNYGSHSLRKTFGYIHRTVFNTDLPTLCHMFNHSTQRQTLAYLGIQERDVQDAYLREI